MIFSNHITASVSIFNQFVYKNNELVFENKEPDPQRFLLSVYEYIKTNYPRFYKMDMLSKLGWLTSEILLGEAVLSAKYQPEEIALVFSNKNSSLDTDIKYFETLKTIASPALFVYTLPNIVMGEICIRQQIKGENAFFIFESFNSAFFAQYCSELLDNHTAEACICGWIEYLNDSFKSVLYLVEKKAGKNSVIFNQENINNIYQQANG